MSATPNTQSNSTNSALIPALLLFGGLTLLLVTLMTMKPNLDVEVVAALATVAPTEAPTLEPTPETATVALDPAKVSAGANSFSSICSACHGFNALGIPGLGKTLVGSEFANNLTDEELVAFISKGRDISDPLNTTGQMMPPRGGNPTLTDDDLMNIVQYIRSLNLPAAEGAAPAATSVPAQNSEPAATATPWTGLNIGSLTGGGSAVEPTATPWSGLNLGALTGGSAEATPTPAS